MLEMDYNTPKPQTIFWTAWVKGPRMRVNCNCLRPLSGIFSEASDEVATLLGLQPVPSAELNEHYLLQGCLLLLSYS
jgi:hypothetical protein